MIAPDKKRNLIPVMIPAAILSVVLMFAVQTVIAQFSGKVASLFSYRQLDPDRAFAWISVHHIVQGLAALVLMLVLSSLFRLDFHLGPGDKRTGMRIVLWFTVLLFVYQFVVWLVMNALGFVNPFAYPVNARNVFGYLSFQLFLSGTSEELLFRAFPIVLLTLVVPKTFNLFHGKVQLPVAVIITAALFSLGHVNWTTNPFRLQYDVLQLLYAFALGVIQGWAFVKTRSVVYPMMMHGISNALVTIFSIVMPILF